MLHPFFFPILGGLIFLLAIASYVVPEKRIGKVDEYLQFFLSSVGSFWLVFMILRNVVDYRWKDLFTSEECLIVLLFVWLTLTHLIYPFKKKERNKQLTLISLTLLAIFIILTAIAWIGMK